MQFYKKQLGSGRWFLCLKELLDRDDVYLVRSYVPMVHATGLIALYALYGEHVLKHASHVCMFVIVESDAAAAKGTVNRIVLGKARHIRASLGCSTKGPWSIIRYEFLGGCCETSPHQQGGVTINTHVQVVRLCVLAQGKVCPAADLEEFITLSH